jgi:hypothetical protein
VIGRDDQLLLVRHRLLLEPPKAEAMKRGRRDEERRGDRRAYQRHGVDVALEVGRTGEGAAERQGQQEREQHLHPGKRDAKLLTSLDHELP